MNKYKALYIDIFQPNGSMIDDANEKYKEITMTQQDVIHLILTEGEWLKTSLNFSNYSKHVTETELIFHENPKSAGFDGLIFYRKFRISLQDAFNACQADKADGDDPACQTDASNAAEAPDIVQEAPLGSITESPSRNFTSTPY